MNACGGRPPKKLKIWSHTHCGILAISAQSSRQKLLIVLFLFRMKLHQALMWQFKGSSDSDWSKLIVKRAQGPPVPCTRNLKLSRLMWLSELNEIPFSAISVQGEAHTPGRLGACY